ncbi:MAG: VWA domain-containing protein [Candidatus Omnitrophota bacterium]
MVSAALFFFIWAAKKKKNVLRLFAQDKAIGSLSRGVSFKRQRLRQAFVVLALLLCVVSLMRPQWGFQWQDIKRRGIDILFAVDVSNSMLAVDIKPDRLTRSKLAIKDLILSKLSGDRIGLIAFAGSAFVQCPFTADYNGFILALDSLDVDTIPRGGTSLSSAIRQACDVYKDSRAKDRVLILITDGEDHDAGALGLAEQAKGKGISIYCIGIGTTEGELIPVIDHAGKRTFLKDGQGNVVKTRLNEDILKNIALTTGGIYVRSSGVDFGLEYIYNQRLSRMIKTDSQARTDKVFYERFQITVFAAFLLLVLAALTDDKIETDE